MTFKKLQDKYYNKLVVRHTWNPNDVTAQVVSIRRRGVGYSKYTISLKIFNRSSGTLRLDIDEYYCRSIKEILNQWDIVGDYNPSHLPDYL